MLGVGAMAKLAVTKLSLVGPRVREVPTKWRVRLCGPFRLSHFDPL